ncbi:nucleolin 1-like isoform X2 [Venturia canescens]|uniref:nucleolin 1-like isoform X2 n=1 Tax=Venturia canescens TaxID=32260 RepID=UPI001C9BC629|nr:nucleolin 1-like isoform X2 [Venturia canescens]
MKIVHLGILVFFCVQRQSNAAVVRKQPAFSTPVYSPAYLPGAMQVIFHAVSQLKDMQVEELENPTPAPTTTAKVDVEATSPHAPGQHQPVFQNPSNTSTTYGAQSDNEASTGSVGSIESSPAPAVALSSDGISTASPADPTELSATTSENSEDANEVKAQSFGGTTARIEAETPEENYATPEVNHEVQEPVEEGQEPVQEAVETNQETLENNDDYVNSSPSDGAKESDVPSVTLAEQEDKTDDDSSEESDEKKNSSEESDEKKSSNGSKDDSDDDSRSLEETKQDKIDSSEEEDEEIRFTMIGEKVSQVPRPSLTNYLRKTAKFPLRNSTQELASLYDALSKDARRQGFAQYSGYSDEVLQTLKSSSEGGVGPQIRTLLEKTLERKELTRDDAKAKLLLTLKNLRDPSTVLNRDLRRLVPLRYLA